MNSVTYGAINKLLTEITTDITNNTGRHNNFVAVTNSENHYPSKTDPVILRYDGNLNEWILVADKTIANFGYLKETIDLIDSDVFLTKEPLDGVMWDIFIIDENGVILKTLSPKELFLDKNLLYGLNRYKGQTLSLMYAFGDKLNSGEIVKVNLPTTNTYLHETIDNMQYDGPYDMNDILVTISYPDANTFFDKIILQRIKELDKAVELMNTRMLYTTERILIVDNKIKLPYKPIGTVVHDMAMLYLNDDITDNMVMMEVTCRVEGNYVIFDVEDNVNEHYAVVSYLAELGTPVL